ncbi:MAG: hypothetical protein J2P25_20410 [Nocardiopsaceae bacterium]|nr:hypothetical protein [Nocardiopsaceae bacterium]
MNAVVEQRVQEAVGDVKAQNAELQQQLGEARAENAEIKQQLDETNAKLDQAQQQLGETNAKLDDQGSKLDAILSALGSGAADQATSRQETGAPEDQDKADVDQRDLQHSPDHPQDEGRDHPDQPERPDKPSATKPDQRNDALGTGDGDEPRTSRDQGASLGERKDTDQGTDTKQVELPRWRRAVTAGSIGAASTLLGAADTATQFAMHATPEGLIGMGAMVLGLAAMGLGKIEKRRKEKHDSPD